MSDIKYSPWKSFSSDILQDYIGQESLGQLSEYLPLLRPKEFDQSTLYKKKNLSKIFNAFSGADLLEKKDFRNDFYSSKSDDILKKISALVLSEKIKFDRQKVIKAVSDIKWVRSDKTL